MGDLTLYEALAGGAFDHLNCQHTGALDQNFSKKSNAWDRIIIKCNIIQYVEKENKKVLLEKFKF